MLKVKAAAAKGPAGTALLQMVNTSAQASDSTDAAAGAQQKEAGSGEGRVGTRREVQLLRAW